ncbi:hypothetical protein ROTAS13_02984 [Roseomonas sp. TAS13]|nr:hypothetical protein ROTAS13_02984 [Roseomonas sp. TAS13]
MAPAPYSVGAGTPVSGRAGLSRGPFPARSIGPERFRGPVAPSAEAGRFGTGRPRSPARDQRVRAVMTLRHGRWQRRRVGGSLDFRSVIGLYSPSGGQRPCAEPSSPKTACGAPCGTTVTGRYWQVQHPERGAYAGWVTKGWQALATSPLRTAAGQSMVSVRAYERQRNGRPEHVSAYTRSGRAGQGSTAATPRPGIVPVQLGPVLLAPRPPVPPPRARIAPQGATETPETGSLPKDPGPPRQKKPGLSGKKAASDVASWARGIPRGQNQTAEEYATKLMNDQYGKGNWERTGKGRPTNSEYSRIKNYGERAFIEWMLGIDTGGNII